MYTQAVCRPTKWALIFLNIVSEPLSAIYTLLPFIFIKDLQASSLQLAIFISLRPLLSFFSFYWGSFWNKNTANLLKNVKVAALLAHLPFLIFSFTSNVWLLLIASAFFQLFHRAGIPAWLEIVKRRIPQKTREETFSLSFAAGFVVSGIFGIFMGTMLDKSISWFSLLLFFASSCGLLSLFFLRLIPISTEKESSIAPKRNPIQDSFHLLRSRRDFLHFQTIFMIGGATLMLMAPALSHYYVENLSLSHVDISYARFIFMALGVMTSSYIWNRLFQQHHINKLIGPILGGFALFPLLLLITKFDLHLLYVAFFIYGIAQTGSHLIWNLSGISFSGGKSAVLFSQVNLLMIGIRGLIFPFLGSLLCQQISAPFVLFLGIIFCLLGAFYSVYQGKRSQDLFYMTDRQ